MEIGLFWYGDKCQALAPVPIMWIVFLYIKSVVNTFCTVQDLCLHQNPAIVGGAARPSKMLKRIKLDQ